MIAAYIFIKCTARAAGDVAKEVSRIEGVKRASATHDAYYDVIVLAEAPSISTLGDFIVTKIQGLSQVIRTQTSVIID